MLQIKDYIASVCGGPTQLFCNNDQINHLTIIPALQNIQNIEHFDSNLWRDLLCEINLACHKPRQGLYMTEGIKPQHQDVIASIILSCDTLKQTLDLYYNIQHLMYDDSALNIENFASTLSLHWDIIRIDLTQQITDEISMTLLINTLCLYFSLQHIEINEVHFRHPIPPNIAIYEKIFQCNDQFSPLTLKIILPISPLNTSVKNTIQTLQKHLRQQADELLRMQSMSTLLDQQLQQDILIGLAQRSDQTKKIAAQTPKAARQSHHQIKQKISTFQQIVQNHIHQLILFLGPHFQQILVQLFNKSLYYLAIQNKVHFNVHFNNEWGQTSKEWRIDLFNKRIKIMLFINSLNKNLSLTLTTTGTQQ